MSGIEVIALISSIITIVDGVKMVYEASAKRKGLPEAFIEVARRLPIVRIILASAKRHIADGNVDEGPCKAIQPVIDSCENKAEKLNTLFQIVVPGDDASRAERYFKAVKTLGKGYRVETLMNGILVDVQFLASRDWMKSRLSAEQLDQFAKAIKEISGIAPSIPDSEFQDTAFTNNNYGPGTQHVFNALGNQHTMTGAGNMYNAGHMNFGKDG